MSTYSEGQILLASKRAWHEGFHLIVYLKQSNKMPGHFIGLMLSTKDTDGNIKMEPDHFTNGFIYNNTHVANLVLLKPESWGPFRKIGSLSNAGIAFVNEKIPMNDNPPLWENI